MKAATLLLSVIALTSCSTPPDWVTEANWNSQATQGYANDLQGTSKPKRLDQQCMQDCSDAGYTHQYCESRCAY